MNLTALRISLLSAGVLLSAGGVLAQTPNVEFPAPSPACTLKQRVGLTDIEIVYSRPGVKGRSIFGGIVPYNAVWRTGANASTRISFSTAVKLNATEVPAGTYALYTIPGESEWTVILSRDTTGSPFAYSPTNDVVRFKTVSVKLVEQIETFTIEFNRIRDESANLDLIWDKTVVPIRLEVELTGKVVSQIEAAMALPDKKQAGFYYQAASFYFSHGQDLKKALAWLDTGLTDQPRIAYELLHLKAQILAKQGDKAGAVAAAKQSSELAVKAEGSTSSFVKMNEDLISSLR